jgi:hypothetical protein
MGKPKRVVVIADKHSGHRVGLTHPDCDVIGLSREGRKWATARKKLWAFYAKTIDALRPIDVLLVNADCIDGRGERSGGVELLTTNRREQCDIAAACILYAKAKAIIMTRGTDYHTGHEEEWEDEIARIVGAKKIGNHEWVEVNGLVFDLKHFVGSSQVDHGRHTATAREKGWSSIWAEAGQAPKSDIIIRCLSEDTEVLTPDGWRGMNDVHFGHSVMSLRRDTNRLEWGPVLGKKIQGQDREMVNFAAKGMDILVTPDHTMIYHPMSSDSWLSRPAADLAGMSTYRLPVAGLYNAPGVDLPDGMVKLLAWVIAEGNMDAGNRSHGYPNKNNVRLFQSASRAEDIESVLREAGVEYTKHLRKQKGQKFVDGAKTYYSKEDGFIYYLRQPFSRDVIAKLNGEKNIPDWLMDMDNRQFRMFLREYVKGDGHAEPGTRRYQGKIFTSNQDLADRLQILLLQNGYKAQVTPRVKWDKVGYVIGFVKKQHVTIAKQHNKVSLVPYQGATWCVATPNGTLLTRRNGRAAIVGNSHVHYHRFCGGPGWLAMTTPALQGLGGRFGSKKMSGMVDFGLVSFDVDKDGAYTWQAYVTRAEQRSRVVRV